MSASSVDVVSKSERSAGEDGQEPTLPNQIDVEITLPSGTVMLIKSIFAGDTIATLRQTLTDYQESACYTCYVLKLKEIVDSEGVTVELAGGGIDCLDYVELLSLLNPTTATCRFNLVLDMYDVKKLNQHVARTNSLIQNPPSHRCVVTEGVEVWMESTNNANSQKKSNNSTSQGSEEAKVASVAAHSKDASTAAVPASSTAGLPEVDRLLAPVTLGNFYEEVLFRTGNAEAVVASGKNGGTAALLSKQAMAGAVRCIFASGWNPVPPARRLQGDLMYLEVVTSSERILYLTATAQGFYINRSNRGHFDPSPASQHHFSHELFHVLLMSSAALRTAWVDVLTETKRAQQQQQEKLNVQSTSAGIAGASADEEEEEESNPMDALAAVYAHGQAEGMMMMKPQWNVFGGSDTIASASSQGTAKPPRSYDLYRTQESLTNLHGAVELGAPRDWNEDIQLVRAMKANDLNEKLMKARLELKIVTEFVDSCKAAAMAISDGLIAPYPNTALSGGEDPAAISAVTSAVAEAFAKAEAAAGGVDGEAVATAEAAAATAASAAEAAPSAMYVYNNIFFSIAEDSKDAFNICVGEAAYSKHVAHDLQNQKLIRSFDIEGLGTALCAIVDYKGKRIIGQTIIPGIFPVGEGAARLMYGIMETDKQLTVKNSSLKLVKDVCDRLHIPQRNVKLRPFAGPEGEGGGDCAATGTAVAATTTTTTTATTTGGAAGAEVEQEQVAVAIKLDEEDNVVDARSPSTPHCGPIEAKVLQGLDGRMYLLEVMRLTPRDANFVQGEKGTGNIATETLAKSDKNLGVTYVLRPELVSIFIQRKLNLARQVVMNEMSKKQQELMKEAREAKAAATASGASVGGADANEEVSDKEKKEGDGEEGEESVQLDKEVVDSLTKEYTTKVRSVTAESLGLRMNPNCFLEFALDMDPEVVKSDEGLAREVAQFLWDSVLPTITQQVQEGQIHPVDGSEMVKLLHRNGVNVRYLGHLANAAWLAEADDVALLDKGKQKVQSMPYFWLEMLLVEMIARASKHVLNGLFKENPSVYDAPAQTVASFLSHILSAVLPEQPSAADAQSAGAGEAAAAGASAGVDVSGSVAGAASKKKSKKKSSKAAGPTPAVELSAGGAGAGGLLPLFASPDAAASRADIFTLIQDIIAVRFCYDLPLTELLRQQVDSPATPPPATPTSSVEVAEEENGVASKEKEANSTAADAAADGDADAALSDWKKDKSTIAAFLQTRISPMALLRRICQCCGIRLTARSIANITSDSTTTAQAQAATAAAGGRATLPTMLFRAEDIVALVPLTKTCEPDVLLPEFAALLETSSTYQQQGNLPYAYDAAQQAAGIATQITGSVHSHVFVALEHISNILIAAGDAAGAALSTVRSLAVSTQLHGLDSSDVSLLFSRLSVLYSQQEPSAPPQQEEPASNASGASTNNHQKKAVQYLLAGKYLIEMMGGPRHPDLVLVYSKLATLYDEMGDFEGAQRCHAQAKLLSSDLMQSCEIMINYAKTFFNHKHYENALHTQKNAYQILRELFLGPSKQKQQQQKQPTAEGETAAEAASTSASSGEKVAPEEPPQLAEVKKTLEMYLRVVNEQKIAQTMQIQEFMKELEASKGPSIVRSAKPGAKTGGDSTLNNAVTTGTASSGKPLNDEEIIAMMGDLNVVGDGGGNAAKKKKKSKAKK